MNAEQKDVLLSAYSYLNKLMQSFDEIIENLSGQAKKYGQTLADGLEGIKWLAEVLLVTHGIHQYKPDIDFLNEQFSVILEGYENEDFVFVSEVIENELMPLLSEWFDIIEETIEEDTEEKPGE